MFGISFALIGIAASCMLVVHMRVISKTSVPFGSVWNFGSEVKKAYRALYPTSRLLIWKKRLEIVGFGIFVIAVILLGVSGILAHSH